MSYIKAKETFEAVIKKMQDDLQAYAGSEKANQKAVDIRLDMINKLIAYYQEAEDLISEQEMQAMALHIEWSKLHTSTQKLANWCVLHHINPNPALLYTKEELQSLLVKGRRFGRPGDYDLPEETREEIIAGSKKCVDFLNDQNQYFEKYRACL